MGILSATKNLLSSILKNEGNIYVSLFNNRVARNSFYNFLGFATPSLLTIIFTPLLVHRMGTEDYGLWNVAISSLGLMGVFEFGLGTALAKFVAEYSTNEDSDGLSAVVTVGFIFNLLIGGLLTLPLYLFAPQISSLFTNANVPLSQIENSIRLASFGFVPLLLRNSGFAIPSGFQKYEIPTIIKIAQNGCTLLIAFLIVLFGGSVIHVVLSTILLMWFFGIISFLIAIRMLREKKTRILLSIEHSRRIFSFMVYTGVTGLGIAMFSSLDRITVGAVLGLSAVTYYTVAIGIANKLNALAGSLSQALMPAASSWQAVGDNRRLKKYLMRSTTIIGGINLIISAFLILLSEPILNVWMGPEFAKEALIPFRILIFVYGVMSVSAPSFHFANGMGFPWINAFGTIVQGVGLVGLIVLLGPKYGLIGASWANASSWIKFSSLVFVSYNLKMGESIFSIKKFNSIEARNDD